MSTEPDDARTDPAGTDDATTRAAPAPAMASLVIRHRRVMAVLVIAWVLIVAANAVSRWLVWTIELSPLRAQVLFVFATGGESTLGTWFTIVMMLGIAVLAVHLGAGERAMDSRWWPYWYGLAAVFVAASLDEQAQLHEILVVPMQRLFGITTGPLLLAWVIPALGFVVVLALVSAPFVLALPRRTRLWFVGSIGLWLLGAVGMEMVDSATFELLQSLGPVAELRAKEVLYAIEESIEMLGIMMLVSTLLVRARDAAPARSGVLVRVE